MVFVAGAIHAQTHRFSVAVGKVLRLSDSGEVSGENRDVRESDMDGHIVTEVPVHQVAVGMEVVHSHKVEDEPLDDSPAGELAEEVPKEVGGEGRTG